MSVTPTPPVDPAPAPAPAPIVPSKTSRVRAFVAQLVKMEEADPAVRAGVRAAILLAVAALAKSFGLTLPTGL